ncbi:MAG TPA: DUF5818 domain-containing protein [Thermoanaerobaculia bacterium]|nr:DUF5818 domain-containing protein [Thermoanaerobaculia bacterium]
MRPRARPLLGAVPLLIAALALPAGASAQYRPGYPPSYRGYGPGPQGTVDGFITADSGRCLVLRDHQRRPYYLSGDTDGLRPGDHVSLRGRTLSRSYCGNSGPTLEVLDVRTVWQGGSHRSAYFDARRDGRFESFLDRSRDRGGWYSDRYSYMQREGDRYGRYGDRGRYAPPNGQYAPPNGPNGQYAPPSEPPEDQGQPPQYEPDDQYGPNGQYDDQGGPPPEEGPYDQNGDNRSDRQPISVDGTLDFNGPCPAVRDGNGASYDLAGNLQGFHNGERVRVTGLLSGSSSCGGTALEIQEIRERR